MKQIKFTVILIAITILSCKEKTKEPMQLAMLQESSNELKYTVETVVDGLSIPWGMAFLPDGSMLITEKKGELIHFKNGKKNNIKGMPEISARGQGGLLDVELDPEYESNGWIYFSYSSNMEDKDNGANTTIMRCKLNGDSLTNIEILYKATPNTKKGQHFGSRIEFDRDGYLYFTIGDRGNRDVNPQDITKDGGKVYRIHKDGSIPSDNPFVNNANAKKGIYSYGHRNPQGMAMHPETGKIWVHEHGPKGGDEINIVKPGVNYGWPKASFGVNYSGTKFTDHTSLPGMEDPIHHWTPSIAPSGMAFVTSDRYPEWKGNVLSGSLKFQYIMRGTLNGDKVVSEDQIVEKLGRVRNIRQAPDGFIYVAIEHKGIVKIVPEGN